MLKLSELHINQQSNNHKILLLLDDQKVTQNILLNSIANYSLYEKHLTLFLAKVLQQGDGFIDIGANVGYFSLVASVLTGNDGLVVSFEPEKHNFKRLQANIAINEFDNIVAYNMAVGDEDKTVSLFFNSDNDGGHALWNPGAHSFNAKSRLATIRQDIKLTKLDSIINNIAIPPIKVIKIDTEGYEHHVLVGATEAIRRHNVPFIAAEMNRLGLIESGSSENLLRAYMQRLGYNTYCYGFDENKNSVFHKLEGDQYLQHENNELVCDFMFSKDEHLVAYGFKVE